jgi:putative effector of murein hydrolase LrgA (UPF0299 family)
MALLGAFSALLLCQLVGEVIVHTFALPLPGPVAGLLLLYVGLALRGGVPESLEAASTALLNQLMLFLVPATTGLMLHLRTLRDEWLPILLATIGGTAVTMLIAGASLRVLTAKQSHEP